MKARERGAETKAEPGRDRGTPCRQLRGRAAVARAERGVTNPDAVAWLKDGLRAFLTGSEGSFVDAFFLDRGEEFQPSGAGDVYFDGSNGRQIHNAYTVQYAKIYREVLDKTRGSESFAWARVAYTGEQQYAVKYGGDTHNRDGVEIPEVPNFGRIVACCWRGIRGYAGAPAAAPPPSRPPA